MASMAVLDNPIAWVQVELRGGVWRQIRFAMICGAALSMVIALSFRADPTSTISMLSAWVKIVLGLQSLVVIVGTCSAITTSIRRDITTRMIESHRLVPISGTEAVLGYIVGCAFQMICLAVMNLLVGGIIAVNARQPLHLWLMSNVILIWFAVPLWAVASYYAMVTQRGFMITLLIIIVGGLSGGVTLAYVPAMIMLIGPLMGGAAFGLSSSGGQWHGIYVVSMVAQAVLGVFFLIAAARRYQRDDAIAFGPWIGLGLVGGWAVLSIIGMAWWSSLRPTFAEMGSIGTVEQTVASTLAGMILSLVPISGAALAEERYNRRKRLNDPNLGRRPAFVSVVAVICAAVCVCLPLATKPAGASVATWAVKIVLLVVSQLLLWAYFLRFLYRRGVGPVVPMVLLICLIWLGPLAGELLRYAVSEGSHWLGTIQVFSPVGTLLAILSNSPLDTTGPLVVEVGLAAVIVGLIIFRGRLSAGGSAQMNSA